MNDKLKVDEIKIFFGDRPFTSDELYYFYTQYDPELNKNTFRWRVHALKTQGLINTIKRGVYVTWTKKDFNPALGKKLTQLFSRVQKQYPYSDMCIWETSWLNNFMVHQAFSSNVILEIDKDSAPAVFAFLQELRRDVYLNPSKHEVDNYIIYSQNNIIVKNLIVTSPLKETQGIVIPTIEKIMVDIFADEDLFVTYQGAELKNIYQEMFRTFNINRSTLKQYANKRHVKNNLISFLKEETDIDNDELFI